MSALRLTGMLLKRLWFVVAMLVLSQSPSLADGVQSSNASVQINSALDDGKYSDFGSALCLVDDPSKSDRNKGLLAFDKNGKPAVYLLCDGYHQCAELGRHTLSAVLAHWNPIQVGGEVFCFRFLAFDGGWKPVRVELKFYDNYCSQFRVIYNDTKIQNWLSAAAIPGADDFYPSKDKQLKLPMVIGIVEGPRDLSDCGIHQLSDAHAKAIKQGLCPLVPPKTSM